MLNWMKRIFARRSVSPERQPDVRLVVIGNTTVGVNIWQPEELLKINTVWRCVNLLCGIVATLPWHVKRMSLDGTMRRVANHKIEALLGRDVNPEMTPFSYFSTLVHHKLLYGNHYSEIELDGAGRAVALWPIAPDRVDPWRTPAGELVFRVQQPTGGTVIVPQERIFHVPGLAFDGIRGYSVLEVALQSLGGIYAMDRFAGGYFGKGMMPGGIIEVPQEVELDPDAMKRIQDEFIEKHVGWQNAGAPLILDQGMKYSPTQIDPEKGQFLDTRKFTVFDVCRWFGVPPYLAFASDEEPRANVETQSREFLQYGADAHITAIEQEVNRKLFEGFRPLLLANMVKDELLLGDLKTRGEFYQTMRQMGAFTVNDILKREGMEPIGPEGDVRVMQVQFQPVGPDGAPTAPNMPMPAEPGAPGTPGEAASTANARQLNGGAH